MILIRWVQEHVENKHKKESVALHQFREKRDSSLAAGGKQGNLS